MSLLYGVAVLILVWWLAKLFAGANPKVLARLAKTGGGVAALGVAGLLMVRGRMDMAIFLGGIGAWLLGWSATGPGGIRFPWADRSGPTPGKIVTAWPRGESGSLAVAAVIPAHHRKTPREPRSLKSRAAQSGAPPGSAAGGDLILWLLLATFVHDHFWLAFFGVLAIVFPVALASQWTYQCSAWINSGTSRCRRPRAGFLQRCHHHTRVMMTQYDAAAAVAIAIAVVNALVLWAALHR